MAAHNSNPDPAPIKLTVFTKADGGILTKRIRLGDDGKAASDSRECKMARGSARRVQVGGVEQLAELICSLRSDQAIALGVLRPDLSDEVAITTKDKLNGNQVDLIARTASDIIYKKDTASFVLLDFDLKGMPSEVEKTNRGVRRVLECAHFGLTEACPRRSRHAHIDQRWPQVH